MFNSRKINNDPEPYIVDFGLALGTVRSSEDAGSHWDSHDTYYDPRPEYDNNPNPALVQARDPEYGVTATLWNLEYAEMPEVSPEQRIHATKVLTRLVNIFGTEEP